MLHFCRGFGIVLPLRVELPFTKPASEAATALLAFAARYFVKHIDTAMY